MSTKIKGHRIDDAAIKLKHIDSTIKIPERMLNLNFSTHSNAGDLTVAQKNTLTQAGNADALHYHTGGGGGPQGIYTNQERDAQILKLWMQSNSSIFGLDKALLENFNDDSSIYRGMPSAKAPLLTCLTDDSQYPGSLQSNQEYSYGISYKNNYGQTNVMSIASIRTGDGFTNAIRLEATDIPDGNTGLSVYRTRGTTEMLLVEEGSDKWENPHGLRYEEYAVDKTAGFTSTAFTWDASENSFSPYLAYNLQTVPDVSLSLNTTPNVNPPFDYYLISSTREAVQRIEVLWDIIPSYAPRDYEIYYTTDTQIVDFETANWLKFESLAKQEIDFLVPQQTATDGTIEGSYRIVNNTTPENKFNVAPTSGITYIRIRVTRIDNLCRLTRVNLLGPEKSHRRFAYLDTRGIDLTSFNTLKFDYKTTGHSIPFQVESMRESESVGNVVNLYNITPASFSATQNEVRDGHILARIYRSSVLNSINYNRVRIGFRVRRNSDFRGENFYLRLCSGSSVVAGTGVFPFYNIPITFGGRSYIECFESSDTEIWSDWVYLPRAGESIDTAEVVFKSVRGQLLYTSVSTSSISYLENNSFIGKEDKPDEFFNDNRHGSRMLMVIQFGRTNNVSRNLTNGFLHSKWHKGYIDIASVNDLRGLKFFTGSSYTSTGTLILDNFTLTKNKNLLGPSVSSGSFISVGGEVRDATSDEYGLSRSKEIYFNQYATVVNPQVVAFEFHEQHVIGQINFTCTTRAKTPTNYVIQYAIDENASMNDSIGSPNWVDVNGLRIGEPSFEIGFEGTIRGGRVIANNISNTTFAHRFFPIETKKIRIWIEGTIGGDIPLINNLEIYSAVDSEEIKLIIDENNRITSPRYVVVDDGIAEKDVRPVSINTTGSSNVRWDKDKKCIDVIDNMYEAVFYTKDIPVSLFEDFMLTAQAIGDITFEVSFDSGESFVPIETDVVNSLPIQSDSIVIKAKMPYGSSLHAFAMLYSL